VESLYDDIMRFMKEYFPAYSDYGQVPETHHVMDKFYVPDLSFDDGMVTSREQWYKSCLKHPDVQDKLTVEHLFIDDRQYVVSALLKTEAIDRASGKILMELKMNALYTLKIRPDKEIKIAKVKIFLEGNPQKVAKLSQLYRIGM
jgi:hypothetical protein